MRAVLEVPPGVGGGSAGRPPVSRCMSESYRFGAAAHAGPALRVEGSVVGGVDSSAGIISRVRVAGGGCTSRPSRRWRTRCRRGSCGPVVEDRGAGCTGLEQADDALHEAVVVGVADGSDRGGDTFQSQVLGEPNACIAIRRRDDESAGRGLRRGRDGRGPHRAIRSGVRTRSVRLSVAAVPGEVRALGEDVDDECERTRRPAPPEMAGVDLCDGRTALPGASVARIASVSTASEWCGSAAGRSPGPVGPRGDRTSPARAAPDRSTDRAALGSHLVDERHDQRLGSRVLPRRKLPARKIATSSRSRRVSALST